MMKAFSLIVIIFECCVCRYTSVEIMLECKKNILKLDYGINFRYKGMPLHSFDIDFMPLQNLFCLLSMI